MKDGAAIGMVVVAAATLRTAAGLGMRTTFPLAVVAVFAIIGLSPPDPRSSAIAIWCCMAGLFLAVGADQYS
jgi:hypothetical protein